MTFKSQEEYPRIVDDAVLKLRKSRRTSNTRMVLELDRLQLALEDIQQQSLACARDIGGISTDRAKGLQDLVVKALEIAQNLQIGIASLSGALRSTRL